MPVRITNLTGFTVTLYSRNLSSYPIALNLTVLYMSTCFKCELIICKYKSGKQHWHRDHLVISPIATRSGFRPGNLDARPSSTGAVCCVDTVWRRMLVTSRS